MDFTGFSIFHTISIISSLISVKLFCYRRIGLSFDNANNVFILCCYLRQVNEVNWQIYGFHQIMCVCVRTENRY